MKGLKPIRTVADLMEYLKTCPPTARILVMPEQGDSEGFPLGGVLAFKPSKAEPYPQVWLLIDEFAELEPSSERMEWSGGPPDCEAASDSTGGGVDDDPAERPGDMAQIEVVDMVDVTPLDVVQVRGRLRSA